MKKLGLTSQGLFTSMQRD